LLEIKVKKKNGGSPSKNTEDFTEGFAQIFSSPLEKMKKMV